MSAKPIGRVYRALLISWPLLALPGSLFAQPAPEPARSRTNLDALARVEIRTHSLPAAPSVEIPYGVYVPTFYDAARPTPLVVALHGLGSGEMYMMEYAELAELAEQYGFLVATPMGYNERGWYGSRGPGNTSREVNALPTNLGELSEQDVMAVLAIMKRDFNVDPDRTYLIGQSMGGGGTWHLGIKYPGIWAAIAPMAPAIYSSPDPVVAARDLPVMVIHGDADESVDVEGTRRWVAKMAELGMDYRYIEVRGGTHFSAGRDNIDDVFAFLNGYRR
ncbi:MAG: poly(3-hydroxybutyrate) depolymerase [Gemmatimonadetes bacterium]|nr:poly(3-hydroxybutyrate) depolymerase [Gemmatimonadota bacterium]